MNTIEMNIRKNEEGDTTYSHVWDSVSCSEVMSIIELFVEHSLSTLSSETRIPRALLLSMLFNALKSDLKEGAQEHDD